MREHHDPVRPQNLISSKGMRADDRALGEVEAEEEAI